MLGTTYLLIKICVVIVDFTQGIRLRLLICLCSMATPTLLHTQLIRIPVFGLDLRGVQEHIGLTG